MALLLRSNTIWVSSMLRAALRQQIGGFRPDGSVETAATPAANNVNLLVETVILNSCR